MLQYKKRLVYLWSIRTKGDTGELNYWYFENSSSETSASFNIPLRVPIFNS